MIIISFHFFCLMIGDDKFNISNMSEEIKFNVVRPFGPSILVAKIPNKILDEINNYVDQIITDSEKSSSLNYGNKLVGSVTQEFLIEKDFAAKSGWLNFLATCVSNWISLDIKKKVTKFEVIETWVVRQFQNEYNPTHWHGGHISGAGFLKLPTSFGKNFQKKDKEFQGGNLQLIHGSRMFLSPSTLSLKPKVGDFYFFPNYMMHTVFPFNGTDEERRSISFNARIDENIYNVYGG